MGNHGIFFVRAWVFVSLSCSDHGPVNFHSLHPSCACAARRRTWPNAALVLDADSTSSVTLTSRGGLLGTSVTKRLRRHGSVEEVPRTQRARPRSPRKRERRPSANAAFSQLPSARCIRRVRRKNKNILDAALVLDADSTSSVTLTSRGGLLGTSVTKPLRRHGSVVRLPRTQRARPRCPRKRERRPSANAAFSQLPSARCIKRVRIGSMGASWTIRSVTRTERACGAFRTRANRSRSAQRPRSPRSTRSTLAPTDG
jgi:hypothetical protein